MSSDYNPNSIWTSKKKKYEYTPEQETPGVKDAKPEGPKAPESPKNVGIRGNRPGKKTGIIIAFCIVLLVILGAGVAAYFILKPPPSPSVAVSFENPGPELLGDPFELQITYANNSQVNLRSATLKMVLPEGVSFEGKDPSQRSAEWMIGDIAPGDMDNESSSLIVTGDPNSIKNITAALTYGTDASKNVQFESDGAMNLVVGDSAVSLTITAPPSVFSGQNFSIKVAYANNASHPLSDVKLMMQYPAALVFGKDTASVSSSPVSDGAVWDLGLLPTGASGSFTLTGSIIGSPNSFFVVAGAMNESFLGQVYPVSNQGVSLLILPSPLSITGSVNDKSNYVAGLLESVGYTFTYANNSSITFSNAVITAKLMGAMFDFKTLQSNGSFNSVSDTLTWSGANTRALASIGPGQSGKVMVIIRTKSAFPIATSSDKNFTLGARVMIESPTVPPGTAASGTIGAIDLENKVGGAVKLGAVGYYEDSTSGILNSGPYPPKVNKQTQYTIHWVITNYSTDIANATVSGYLQSGTTCTGNTKSNVPGAEPTCDPATGLVTWTIPSIPGTTGVISPPAEAVFQVENTPAINQVGQDVTLLGPVTLTASDTFTGATLQSVAPEITTSLPNDKSAGNKNRQVTQ